MFEHDELQALRRAIDGVSAADVGALGHERLEARFRELQRATERLEVERLRHLAEIERRGLFARSGHLSVASWLSARCRVAWIEAKRDASTARALERMPATRRALADGEVSMSAARTLVAVRRVDPTAFADDERELVEAARIHSMGDLQRVAGYWRQQVERERASDGDDAPRARRRLRASATFMGMVRVDGDLDPETGETLLTALSAGLDADARSSGADDRRSPAQRRADALGEICRQWLDGADRPAVGGERPHVALTVDAEALARGDAYGRHTDAAAQGTDADGERTDSDGRRTDAAAQRTDTRAGDAHGRVGVVSELGHVGPVPVDLAKRLACDASVLRMVMSAPSEPLDVGRRTAVVSPAMRRALIARDGGCRFPGCDRPPAWCDAHHVVHWADGGPTSLGNLVLLCRRHHRIVHGRGEFRVAVEDGRIVFRDPGGAVLEPISRRPGPFPGSPASRPATTPSPRPG